MRLVPPEESGELAVPEDDMCQHQPRCPHPLARDRMAARVAASHPEQGWSLLCNGIVLFDDAGALMLYEPAISPSSGRIMAAA